MGLSKYKEKRDFEQTPEPSAKKGVKHKVLSFVVHRHDATRLHYDLRLEMEGVLKSWAVPKGPSMVAGDKRLAVMVEDHPIDYGKFYGEIPEGNYGAGVVDIWDTGTYTSYNAPADIDSEKLLLQQLQKGDLKFVLNGNHLKGAFALVRMKGDGDKNWLLIKKKDGFNLDVYNIEEINPITPSGFKKRKKSSARKATSLTQDIETAFDNVKSPMLATLVTKATYDPNWIYELKYDGYRAITKIQNQNAEIVTKNGNNFTEQFKSINSELAKIKEDVILDGEIVFENDMGYIDFKRLQNYTVKHKGKLVYYIFDLLFLNGHSIIHLPLVDRKELLSHLIRNYKFKNIVISPFVQGNNENFLKNLSSKGADWIIAKDPASEYAPGKRARTWLKITSKYNQGKANLEISFTPKVVKGEQNQIIAFGQKKLKVTNLTKIYWPDEGITKGDLIHYYQSISQYILPYLKNRPQSLNRFPNGIEGPSFYHKDMEIDQLPSWAKTVKMYSKSNDKNIDYLICNNVATLVYMTNLGCIEINPWHSTYGHPDNPDYMILDLDPGKIDFSAVVDTALVIKEICDELSIKSYCKTSGATGLHIYIPLGAKNTYDQVKSFAEILANIAHQRLPTVTSVERMVAKRKDKVYIDYLQNRRGQTIAAPYSVRPRAEATVSTPIKWEEVNKHLSPLLFNIHNIGKRLGKTGDLWQGIFKKPISILKVLNQIEKLR